jgi:outer membrane receptor protein involved in Fe transport
LTAAHAKAVPAAPAAIGEIVVTAQKREERLSQVPIAISVLGGVNIDKSSASTAVDVLRTVPGVAINLTNQGATPQISMRGVGAVNSILSGASPIGFYLDGVPFSFPKSPIVPDPNVFDLNRVEVLRGPQGTLYGVNALNGVIRVLTNDANLNKYDLKMRVGVAHAEGGSGTGYNGDLAVNVPIVEGKLAVRAVVGYEYVPGTIDSPTRKDIDSAKVQNYRLKINAQPIDRLSIGLSAWHSKTDLGAPTASNNQGIYPFVAASNQMSQFDTYGANLGYDFDAFTVHSTTSFADYQNFGYLRDLPLETNLTLKSLSEEVLVSSKATGPLRWSFGGIYRDVKDQLFQNSPTQAVPINFYDTSKSYAAFGELTWVLFDGKLDLTGGGRYYNDKVGSGENTRYFPTLAAAAAGANRALIATSQNYNAVTPRLVGTWHFSQDALAYASYSEGFRSGFAQYPTVTTQFPNFPSVAADKLHNYELGSKLTLLDRKLSLEGALYYIEWDGVQQTLSIPSFPGSSVFVTAPVNGSSASGLGLDLGATARPIPRLTLNATFSVNGLGQDKPVLFGTTVLFNKGDRLTLSPKYTGGGGVDYAIPISDDYQVHLAGSMYYVSAMQVRAITSGALHIGTGDDILSSRISVAVEAPSHWSASLFIDNLNNNNGKTSVTLPTTFPPPVDFPSARLRPRTIGIQLDYHL